MAHAISLPHDKVLSVQGSEWHGLAELHPVISSVEVEPLMFDIIESPSYGMVDGNIITIPGEKTLLADYRKCRTDLAPEEQIVHLHTPKDSYRVISNREVWGVMEKSLLDLGVKITTAGTLEKGKKFFISTDIGSGQQVINGDKFETYLNFVTSHDGTLAMKAYDSMTRIVCQNTLRASMQTAGEVGFSVQHTKNANLALDNLPELINAILAGRADNKEILEYLADFQIDSNLALAYATGYFCKVTGEEMVSTRSRNAAESITNLFANGIGNRGRNLYDLVNGVTEYFTSGDGVGRKSTSADKAYKANFGAAADHKDRFFQMITSDHSRESMLDVGQKAIELALAA